MCILTNSMLRTYTSDRDERIILQEQVKFLEIFREVSPILLHNDFVKVAKIRHVFVKLQRIVFTKVSLCFQINSKQNITFQF